MLFTRNMYVPSHAIETTWPELSSGNILLLRENIVIQPPGRKTVSYEFLSQLVADYLLINFPGVDISSALTVLPLARRKGFRLLLQQIVDIHAQMEWI